MRLDDPERLAALCLFRRVESRARRSLDGAVRIVARGLGVPVALVTLVDDRGQRFVAHHGLGGRLPQAGETPLSHSFCQHVVSRERILVVRDALADPLVAGNPAIASLGVRAYLGAPLRIDGMIVGALCAIAPTPRAWTVEDEMFIVDVADALMTALALEDARCRVQRALSASEQATWDILVRGEEVRLQVGEPSPIPVDGRAGADVGRAWLDAIHPDDRTRVQSAYHAVRDGRAEQIDEQYRVIVDGRERWLRSQGRVAEREADGATLRVAGIVTDVTLDRRDRERALRDARLAGLETGMPDVELVADRECRLVAVNERALAAYGRSREELLSMTLRDLRAPETRGDFAMSLAGVLERGEARFETRHLRADGSTFPVYVSSRMLEVRGEMFFHSIVRDLTEVQAAEQRLARAQKIDSLGMRVGGVAHDFNNVLTAISLNLDGARLLLPDGSPAAESVDGAKLGIRRGRELVALLLDHAGRAPTLHRPIVLAALVFDTLAMFRAAVPAGIEIQISVPPEICVVGDRVQLRQAITNLVLNAVQAIAGRRGKVVIDASRSEAGALGPASQWIGVVDSRRSYVVVSVADDGPGMSDEVRQRIFEPFFTTRDEGRGLGLAAVLAVLHAHRGVARVESLVGSGARFLVAFPDALDAN